MNFLQTQTEMHWPRTRIECIECRIKINVNRLYRASYSYHMRAKEVLTILHTFSSLSFSLSPALSLSLSAIRNM